MKLSDLDRELTRREGGKKSVSIAQVKEIRRHLCDIMADMASSELLDLVRDMLKQGGKPRRK